MAVDWQEARRLVDVTLRPTWEPRVGEGRAAPEGGFHVAEWGWEDAWAYWVPVGAHPALTRGSLMWAGSQVVLVTKASGNVRLEDHAALRTRLRSMTRVGSGHPPGV